MQQFRRLSAVMALCVTVACAEELGAPHPEDLDLEAPVWSEASTAATIVDLAVATLATATDWGPQDGIYDEFAQFNLGSVNNNGYTSFRTVLAFDLSGLPAWSELQAATLAFQLANFEGTRSIEIHAFVDDGTAQLDDFAINALIATIVADASGSQTFTIDATDAVAAARAAGADFVMFGVREEPANASNYLVMAIGPHPVLSLRLAERRTVEVTIDVRPGSSDNCINLTGKGVLPVAILSGESFDATTVDPTTVTLSGAGPRTDAQGRPLAAVEDVNGDGLLDLVIHVETRDLALAISDGVASLVGATVDGTPIHGTDAFQADCGSGVVLDQLSGFASPAPFTIAIGNTSAQILAQVVTPGVSGRLVELGLAVGCSSNPPSDLTLEIRDVDEEHPGGTVLLQVIVPHEAVDQEGDWDFRHIGLGDGVAVSEGTPFAFVLSSSGACATLPGLEGDPYVGGDGWVSSDGLDAWGTLGHGRPDLPFQTYVLVHGGQP